MTKAQARREAKKITAGLICNALAGEWDETETHIQSACKTDADAEKVAQALSELAQSLSLKRGGVWVRKHSTR